MTQDTKRTNTTVVVELEFVLNGTATLQTKKDLIASLHSLVRHLQQVTPSIESTTISAISRINVTVSPDKCDGPQQQSSGLTKGNRVDINSLLIKD
jgi:hypothetical protein